MIAGMMGAVQSRVNGGLGQELGNGFIAAIVSFGTGLVIIAVVTLFSYRARNGLRELRELVAEGRFPWWALFGGFFGALFVLSQSLVAPELGVALFTVGLVAGMVAGGLGLDRIGLGPAGKVQPSPQRIIGTVLVVVAVGIAVSGELGGGRSAWLVIFPFLTGLGISLQSATNGLVRSAAQSAVATTLLNFITGTSLLLVAVVISVSVQGWPEVWPTNPVLYIGGALGTIFIAVGALLVRTLGVLLLSMSNIAGQLIASVLLDLGAPLAGLVTWPMVVGASVGLVAVGIAAVPRRAGRSGRA